MVMSCQDWPPWLVPSPLDLAFEVTFQRLAKEVGLWTGRTWGELGHNLQAPGVFASKNFLAVGLGSGEQSDILFVPAMNESSGWGFLEG